MKKNNLYFIYYFINKKLEKALTFIASKKLTEIT
jgi:hypothetical protein